MLKQIEKVTFIAIQTESDIYIEYNWNNYPLKDYLFDNKASEPTFNQSWRKIKKIPKKISYFKDQGAINYRFELIDKSLDSDKIPLTLSYKEATGLDGYEYKYDEEWLLEYATLKSLYQLKYDTPDPIEISIDFDFIIILKIDNIKEYAGFVYPVQKTKWISDGKINITEKNIEYQELDKIIFPDLTLPSRPSSLSSEDTYKIIREYIKNNINPKAAEITSDYDFCFTVQKKVKLAKPYTKKWENLNKRGKSYRPPCYNTRFVETKSIQAFEMTHTGERNGGYKGYTPIKGFKGDNQEDLQKNIDTYLEELINYINAPLKECECCNGVGVIDNK